jgi:cob(I)alamin adenosyltransferase
MKIYTKTGDTGETGLFGGGRVRKDHPRIAAYGTLDELNATLGVARAEVARSIDLGPTAAASLDALLGDLQNRLFDLGAELAAPDCESMGTLLIEQRHVDDLERAIDEYESGLPTLTQFILPGGNAAAAQLHVARCVCRRAEREIVSLAEVHPLRDLPIRYVNRLSDLLFVLARAANHGAGGGDVPWEKAR